MEDLLKMVLSKVDIPEAQARQVIELVLGFVKDKLPAPIAGQLDDVLAGKLASIVPDAGQVTGGLGRLVSGLFGGGQK